MENYFPDGNIELVFSLQHLLFNTEERSQKIIADNRA